MKKGYLILLLGAIPAAGLAILSALNPINVSETSADSNDESLRTRHYKTDLKTFADKTEKIVPTLAVYAQNWRLISANVYENSASIKVEVPVLIFTDDLEIKAAKIEDKEEISVNVHSKSRVGSSDLGENRRHVLQILEVLDKEFGQNKSEN